MNQKPVRWTSNGQPTIDITPGAGWRRRMHRTGASLVAVLELPLLGLLGALAVLVLLGGVVVALLWGAVRHALP